MAPGAGLIAALVLLLGSITGVRGAEAQGLAPELRTDGIFARNAAWLAGAGASFPLSRSLALAVTGMGAIAREDEGERARAELMGRFLLDPERQSASSVYLSAGAAAVLQDDHRWTGALAVMLGAELGRRPTWAPFVEAGFARGVRAAAGVRWR